MESEKICLLYTSIAIPYVDAFIENEDIENKKIFVHLIKGMYDED